MTTPPASATPWTPRLVATDLDGTLLDSTGSVSARTREVLDALDARGVPVVFVTGRPIRWMEALWDAVGGHGLAVCSNGAVVYDVATHTVHTARPVDPPTVLAVARRLRRAVPGTVFALEQTHGFAREEGFLPRFPPPGIPVGPVEELVDESVVKLLARHDELEPEPFWRRVEAEVGELVTTTWSTVGALVEMSAPGVTKASTLEMLCQELDVPAADVIAFGDMPNDLPLLQWAGHAYAMADAHPSVRAAATAHAPGHDEDGVAAVLTRVFDL